MDDKIINGTFYEQELVKYENSSFEIDKIIRRQNKLLVNGKDIVNLLGLINQVECDAV